MISHSKEHASIFAPHYSRVLFIRHLEGAQPQLDVQPGRDAGVLRQEGEHCVVHPKQRDKEQGGFSQPPDEKAKSERQDYRSEHRKRAGRS